MGGMPSLRIRRGTGRRCISGRKSRGVRESGSCWRMKVDWKDCVLETVDLVSVPDKFGSRNGEQ